MAALRKRLARAAARVLRAIAEALIEPGVPGGMPPAPEPRALPDVLVSPDRGRAVDGRPRQWVEHVRRRAPQLLEPGGMPPMRAALPAGPRARPRSEPGRTGREPGVQVSERVVGTGTAGMAGTRAEGGQPREDADHAGRTAGGAPERRVRADRAGPGDSAGPRDRSSPASEPARRLPVGRDQARPHRGRADPRWPAPRVAGSARQKREADRLSLLGDRPDGWLPRPRAESAEGGPTGAEPAPVPPARADPAGRRDPPASGEALIARPDPGSRVGDADPRAGASATGADDAFATGRAQWRPPASGAAAEDSGSSHDPGPRPPSSLSRAAADRPGAQAWAWDAGLEHLVAAAAPQPERPWPALPDAPHEAREPADDTSSLERRLERAVRLEREQRAR
jgi:hypothetical protein